MLVGVFLLSLAAAVGGAEAAASRGSVGEWLTLSGWPPERLAALREADGRGPDAVADMAALARRLRRLPRRLADQAAPAFDGSDAVPRLAAFAGRVTSIAVTRLPPDDASRLDTPACYRLRVETDRGAAIDVATTAAPRRWLAYGRPLDEPVTGVGVVLPGEGGGATLVVAPRVRWAPTEARLPWVNFGESLLGSAGVDVGRLDELADGKPLLATDAEAFYSALAGCREFGSRQLLRAADENLSRYAARWPTDGAGSAADRRLARAVAASAAAGRYSVAPLFNDADRQRGELVALEGVARRAVRIDASRDRDGRPSAVPERFGFDHYFEIEVFAEDSQNLPLVFCVLELPEGFPTGEAISEPVRVAGFFLKRWAYRTRRPGGSAPDADRRQLAPLLVGRGPVRVATAGGSGAASQALAGAAFVAVLVAVILALRRQGAADRRFAQETLAKYTTESRSADD